MKKIYTLSFIFLVSVSIAKSQPGSVDWSFQPDFDFNVPNPIRAIELQSDGGIILGGLFKISFLTGGEINNLLRLDKDGKLDVKFNISFSSSVLGLSSDENGKIIATGSFDYVSSIKYRHIRRIYPDGTTDFSFNPQYFAKYRSLSLSKIKSDKKIIVVVNDISNKDLLLGLNADGSSDPEFNFGIFNNLIQSLCLQPNGKILVGGNFTEVNYQKFTGLVRLNKDGNPDWTFNPVKAIEQTGFVKSIILQTDGKILVGGNKILRLNEDGSIDMTFKSILNSGIDKVNTIFLQKDGKIIIGGEFLLNKNKNIVRLNSDGSLDTTFKTGDGFDNQVTCIIPQGQNKIIVAGNFSSYDSYLFSRIIRLNIENSIKELTVSISPNPSSGNFKINSSQSLNLITITDAVGKEILRTEPMAFDSEIDLSDKSPGMYFVKVFSQTGSKCQKILKR